MYNEGHRKYLSVTMRIVSCYTIGSRYPAEKTKGFFYIPVSHYRYVDTKLGEICKDEKIERRVLLLPVYKLNLSVIHHEHSAASQVIFWYNKNKTTRERMLFGKTVSTLPVDLPHLLRNGQEKDKR